MGKIETAFFPVILVDDEKEFRQVLARRLEKKGFSPIPVADGPACLKLLASHPVSVVVLDVRMPVMNGIEVLKAIKDRFDHTQVILLTGNADIGDGIEGMKAGAFDYLTKPVDMPHLTEKIRQAFHMIALEQEKQKEKAYRKKLEQKMVDTQRLVALGTMSTGIAHEINNPLAIISESAEFIRMVLDSAGRKTFPRYDELIKGVWKIQQSVQRAKMITHQLLGHVKKQNSETKQVNILQLIDDTLELMDHEIARKQVKVQWRHRPDDCYIWVDPFRLRQVLINLLNNAVDAVKENGQITLSVKKKKDLIEIEIQDNGTGILKENINHIFDPFFTTKAFDKGTGLGLFVVHQILGTLNADIDVKSSPGQGTVFTVRLPDKAGSSFRNKDGQ